MGNIDNLLAILKDNYENTQIEYHNEFTYEHSRGVKKGKAEFITIIKEYKEQEGGF